MHGAHELAMSALLTHWLLRQFISSPQIFTPEVAEEVATSRLLERPEEEALWNFVKWVVQKWLRVYDRTPLELADDLVEEALKLDIVGSMLQAMLTPEERKSLAANYTSLEAARTLVAHLPEKEYRTVADPFCGSGRLITSLLADQRGSHVEEIYLNDIMPSAVLLAYCRIFLHLRETGRTHIRIHTSIGDAFIMFRQEPLGWPPKVRTPPLDLVIMNPPFTRVQAFLSAQMTNLEWMTYFYPKMIHGQSGLHMFAMYLGHLLLGDRGVVAAVLPSSTFMSNYSEVFQTFFLSHFSQIVFATHVEKISLTEDSALRELLVIGIKNNEKPQQLFSDEPVMFLRLYSKKTIAEAKEKTIVQESVLRQEWNWTRHFHPSLLKQWFEKITTTGMIKTGEELRLTVVRGVEMYGKDFFFLPNKHWHVDKAGEAGLLVRHTSGVCLEIGNAFLSRILRKSGNYPHSISPRVEDFAILVPKDATLPPDLEKYLKISDEDAKLAKKHFGKDWLNHVHRQLQTKNPYGYVFVVDKLPLRRITRIALFSEELLPCTKNFFVFTGISLDFSKFIAAWLNSSFFLILFLNSRREIGGSYGRLNVSDYRNEKLFLDRNMVEEEHIKEIMKAFDEMRSKKLPPIEEQVFYEPRMKLDIALAKALGFPKNQAKEIVMDLHESLAGIFREFRTRDSTKIKREK